MDRTALKSLALGKARAKGEAAPVIQGIYRFEGERLLICYTQGGRERPTAFDDAQDSNYVMTLQRAGR